MRAEVGAGLLSSRPAMKEKCLTVVGGRFARACRGTDDCGGLAPAHDNHATWFRRVRRPKAEAITCR